jgi:hypothetical protein
MLLFFLKDVEQTIAAKAAPTGTAMAAACIEDACYLGGSGFSREALVLFQGC